MSKRTIYNCSIIKKAVKNGIGECGSENGKCIGYAGEDGDEPCNACKECKLNAMYSQE